MNRAHRAIYFIACLVFILPGCASLRVVDSDVTAFYQWNAAPPEPGTAYRFERLPSQRVVGTQQDTLEELARKALAKVGMQADAATARYSVQVSVNTLVIEQSPYGYPGYDGFGFAAPRFFLQGGSRGSALDMGFPMRFSAPYYRRELSLIMRDLGSSQVVFETRAVNEGGQGDTLPVLSAMLDAALRGFPQPAGGTHRIRTEMAR